ncbi:MBL fold metallo-hydrolase [bacterium]|nr:MBL fold metallo-hydrolase [bacterium]
MAEIEWLGHASFRIRADIVLYIDPWKLKGKQEKADFILISHSHFDHLSAEDIEKVRRKDTVIVAPEECQGKITGDVWWAQPGQSLAGKGLSLKATPAYNIGKQFHPKENGWVGYVIALGGENIYYAGDTDVIPEMEELENIDVALLPIGGTYTMNPEEGARAAECIRPGRCIPYHWGDIVGTLEDAEAFKAACSVPVEIQNPYE